MTTSGTYQFNPALGEIVLYAYMNIGIRPTALLQEHMDAARMAVNMELASYANRGVNLWAVDLITTDLVEGQRTYDVDPSTVMILDAYVRNTSDSENPVDRIILPVSRTEYASYPNKLQQGFTTIFWFDRLINPTITLWPVPDGQTAQVLRYYRVRQIQDANLANGEQVEVPYRWVEALADGLTYRLARIWAPDRAVALKAQADESYQIAAAQDTENVQISVAPILYGYWRT